MYAWCILCANVCVRDRAIERYAGVCVCVCVCVRERVCEFICVMLKFFINMIISVNEVINSIR